MKKSEIFMGILTAVFLISGGLYIKSDINKHQVKPCGVSYTQATEEVKEYKEPLFSNNKSVEIQDIEQSIYTEEEIELLARVIMTEAGILPYHGKLAVMATIMNRVNSDEFPDTIFDVIHQENQYSTAYNGDPTHDCYTAIYDYIPGSFPEDMYYFRADYPHSFAYEYCHIGNTYFSTKTNCLMP